MTALQLNNVALFLDQAERDQPISLPLDAIQTPPSQPRRYFSPDAHRELVASINRHGVLQPILVRPLDDGLYELVAGERRYQAAREAGLTDIPVIIKSLNEQQATELALIENLQREDLNPLEETDGILSLLSLTLQKPISEVRSILYRMQNEANGKVTGNVSRNPESDQILEVFQSLGTISWESFIRTRLRLLSLPDDVLEVLRQGQIEYTKALLLAKIKDDNLRKEVVREVIAQKLTLSQIKEKIQSLLSTDNQPSSDHPQQRIKNFTARLKKTKIYQDPKTWKKIEGYLSKIESLLEIQQS